MKKSNRLRYGDLFACAVEILLELSVGIGSVAINCTQVLQGILIVEQP